MDNIIFMSEIVDAASNCNKTMNQTVNNFSNIINSSCNASNIAQNAVKNIDNLIQEVAPNIGIQGIIGGSFWKPQTEINYVAQINGSLILHTEWRRNENSEKPNSYDFDEIHVGDTISNVNNEWTKRNVIVKELFSVYRYGYRSSSGSDISVYETYSIPIPIIKNYVYKFITNKCNYCFIETIN